MACRNRLEKYIKDHQPTTSAAVYEAGKKVGFTRSEIKKARRWHGSYIDTDLRGGTTLWRWAP